MKSFFPLLAVCVFVLANASIAQKQNVYFLTKSGNEVSTKDSADFIRIVSEPDSGTVLYNITEYYANGKLKMIGKTSSLNGSDLEGRINSFFPSGKKRQVAYYLNGKLNGEFREYFPNGTLYTLKEYSGTQKNDDDFLIKTCNDSLGKSLVSDGNGYYIGYGDNFKNVTEEGSVSLETKNGDWKIYEEETHEIIYRRKYDMGNLVSEEKNLAFTEEIPPKYPGGEAAFEQFLNKNIRYPQKARRDHVQGRAYVSFIVEKDGTPTNFIVLRSPSTELGEEALRVLKLMPKWAPGLQYGKPVRISFTIPVNFPHDN